MSALEAGGSECSLSTPPWEARLVQYQGVSEVSRSWQSSEKKVEVVFFL